jgi:hypothetical protein
LQCQLSSDSPKGISTSDRSLDTGADHLLLNGGQKRWSRKT